MDYPATQPGLAAPQTIRPNTMLRRAGRICVPLLPLLAGSLYTSNPELTAMAAAVAALIYVLLWRRGEPPILLFVAGFQWLQATAAVFHADVLGVDVATMSRAHQLSFAVELSLLWVAATAMGMWLACQLGTALPPEISPYATARATRALMGLYMSLSVVVVVIGLIPISGVRSIFYSASGVRWAVLYSLCVVAMHRGVGRAQAAALVAFEVATGFLSFFASFKEPLYVLMFAIAANPRKMRPGTALFGALVLAGTIWLGVLWSAVKMDYRDAINEDSGAQIVTVSIEEQVSTFLTLVGNFDQDAFSVGLEKLAERIAYVEYFAYVLDYVPAVRDYEYGTLWSEAVMHVLTPRILFPDKPDLELDTLVTERYTGLRLVNDARSTSISIGAHGESYIDFGLPGMFGAAALLGLMLGGAYQYFCTRKRATLLAHGCTIAVLLGRQAIETRPVKQVGGLLSTFIIVWLFWRFVLVPFSEYWARESAQSTRP
jgi:hypothetical protein